MGRKRFSPEQIIVKLREAEIFDSKCLTQVGAAKKLGIVEQTLIRWRQEYGGLRVDEARRFKELEKENAIVPYKNNGKSMFSVNDPETVYYRLIDNFSANITPLLRDHKDVNFFYFFLLIQSFK